MWTYMIAKVSVHRVQLFFSVFRPWTQFEMITIISGMKVNTIASPTLLKFWIHIIKLIINSLHVHNIRNWKLRRNRFSGRSFRINCIWIGLQVCTGDNFADGCSGMQRIAMNQLMNRRTHWRKYYWIEEPSVYFVREGILHQWENALHSSANR